MKTVKNFCIIIITVLISLVFFKTNIGFNPQVAAVGTGSDTTCTNASDKDINPNDSGSTTPFSYLFDAGDGKIVDGVCIKSGENMFGDSHSDLLGNGSYESGCYTISGVGTQTVTVTRNLSGSDCQVLSHLDINVSASPTPSPTSIPTGTPTPTPTLLPTPTPTETPNEDKVSLCHATASYTNPYEFISVALSAADGGGDNGDHFNEHIGPIFDPLVNKSGDNWGDIIPPISGVHGGLNWTTEGQALFRNECVFTAPTPTPTQGSTPTPTPGQPGRGGDGGSSTTTTTSSNPGVPGEVQGVQTASQGQLQGVLGLSTTSSGSKTNPYLAYMQLMGALYFSLEAYKRFIRTS